MNLSRFISVDITDHYQPLIATCLPLLYLSGMTSSGIGGQPPLGQPPVGQPSVGHHPAGQPPLGSVSLRTICDSLEWNSLATRHFFLASF